MALRWLPATESCRPGGCEANLPWSGVPLGRADVPGWFLISHPVHLSQQQPGEQILETFIFDILHPENTLIKFTTRDCSLFFHRGSSCSTFRCCTSSSTSDIVCCTCNVSDYSPFITKPELVCLICSCVALVYMSRSNEMVLLVYLCNVKIYL